MSSHLNDPHQGIQKGKTKLNEINYQLKSLSPPRNSKLNKPGFDTPPANLSQYTRHRLQDAQNAIDDVKSIEEYLESPSRRVNLGKTTIQNIFEESSKNLANRLKSSSKNTNVNSLLSPPEFPIGASQLPRRKPPPPPPSNDSQGEDEPKKNFGLNMHNIHKFLMDFKPTLISNFNE